MGFVSSCRSGRQSHGLGRDRGINIRLHSKSGERQGWRPPFPPLPQQQRGVDCGQAPDPRSPPVGAGCRRSRRPRVARACLSMHSRRDSDPHRCSPRGCCPGMSLLARRPLCLPYFHHVSAAGTVSGAYRRQNSRFAHLAATGIVHRARSCPTAPRAGRPGACPLCMCIPALPPGASAGCPAQADGCGSAPRGASPSMIRISSAPSHGRCLRRGDGLDT